MKLRRSISNKGLLMTSLGAMIGSGWLFGAMYAAQLAGPAAIISWVIGGILLIIIGLNYAELATALPLTGGIVRFTHITHGSVVSFIATWLAWLSCVATAPTEAQAMLQYASHYLPWTLYYHQGTSPLLTHTGWALAVLLVFLFSIINIYAIRLVTRFNSLITYWKLLIPLLVLVVIFFSDFHPQNFSQYHGFAPHGLHGVLWAIPAAGIIFSFLGFRECISLAGETKNPARAIPLALIGSVTICTLLYVALQIVFVGALGRQDLSHGWNALSLGMQTGPLASIALALGITWMVKLIYIDAIISPAGTGVIYTTTTARLNYGVSANRYMPQLMMRLNRQGLPFTRF
ncbi:APC family permease [Dongshaea marina]|uniref:APC family permease n=1 Tax=Dongshaea marina TaxID=2047966 RepID=UPI000D3E70C9|nr:APC family permease [Dongshaea marina]